MSRWEVLVSIIDGKPELMDAAFILIASKMLVRLALKGMTK